MFQLTPDQAEAVAQLQRQRDAQGVAQAMAQAWPEVAERLQARWPAFVVAAAERGHQLGLADVAHWSRYVSLCCLWGVGFEAKPGFEWAHDIVADGRRAAGLQVHQLVTQSRQALAAQAAAAQAAGAAAAAPAPLTPAAFDKALAQLDTALAGWVSGRGLFTDVGLPPPPKACDLASVTVGWREPPGLMAYRVADGVASRQALPSWAPAAQVLTVPPDEPIQQAIISHAAGRGAQARLNLAVQALASCGDSTHPEVQHITPDGRSSWHGRDAALLSLALLAPADEAPDPQAGPAGIGHALPAPVHKVNVDSCGVRDAGAPFHQVSLAVQVHAATQWLTEVRHAALAPHQHPADGQPPAADAPSLCRLEADGVAQAVPSWQRNWRTLPARTRTGVEKLFNAWSRAMTGGVPRLEGELSPMVGHGLLCWGWQRRPDGSVALKADGQHDWVPLALDLTLTGQIELGGARAQLTLRAQGRDSWQQRVAEWGGEAAEGEGLAQSVHAWRHPFVLSLDAIAGTGPAMLSALQLPEPLAGAITGRCGLKPRPDGLGLQWFFTLQTEAVNLAWQVADPLRGDQRGRLELLPAMTLIDWSAG